MGVAAAGPRGSGVRRYNWAVGQELVYRAEEILSEAAARLAELLREAAARLKPFPRFPGAEFETLEVPIPPNARPDLGCVVLAPDGRLYEYEINLVGDSFSPERVENLKPLDLTPAEFILYAYMALVAVARALEPPAQGGTRWTSN